MPETKPVTDPVFTPRAILFAGFPTGVPVHAVFKEKHATLYVSTGYPAGDPSVHEADHVFTFAVPVTDVG